MGRTKLNRASLKVRVEPNTPSKLKQIALALGYQWGADGNTGAFLDDLSDVPAQEIQKLLKRKHLLQK